MPRAKTPRKEQTRNVIQFPGHKPAPSDPLFDCKKEKVDLNKIVTEGVDGAILVHADGGDYDGEWLMIDGQARIHWRIMPVEGEAIRVRDGVYDVCAYGGVDRSSL